MFGFFGLMAVLLGLILLGNYWVSWDLEDKRNRSPFATTARRDFVALMGKWRDRVRGGERQPHAALDAFANRSH